MKLKDFKTKEIPKKRSFLVGPRPFVNVNDSRVETILPTLQKLEKRVAHLEEGKKYEPTVVDVLVGREAKQVIHMGNGKPTLLDFRRDE